MQTTIIYCREIRREGRGLGRPWISDDFSLPPDASWRNRFKDQAPAGSVLRLRKGC